MGAISLQDLLAAAVALAAALVVVRRVVGGGRGARPTPGCAKCAAGDACAPEAAATAAPAAPVAHPLVVVRASRH
ncbi:MAG: hypothetical protein AB7O28_05645 [Vicinamibacterales bacterium]